MTSTLALIFFGVVLAVGVIPPAWSAWRSRHLAQRPPKDDAGARLVALLRPNDKER